MPSEYVTITFIENLKSFMDGHIYSLNSQEKYFLLNSSPKFCEKCKLSSYITYITFERYGNDGDIINN